MINTSSEAFQKLKDIARRRRFIANQIKNGFAFQVRALRKERELTQQQLASVAETTQTVISRIEKNGASTLNVKTLLKIAEAFDVALVVRLEPIDRLLDWVDNLSPDAMTPRRSGEVLTELERVTSQEKIAASANARRAIWTSRLQAVNAPNSTAGLQQTLPLGTPQRVPSNQNSTANRATVNPSSIAA